MAIPRMDGLIKSKVALDITFLRNFSFIVSELVQVNPNNKPFSKMAAENLNKSKLKTNTSARKSTLILVALPSFVISGEISAEKM